MKSAIALIYLFFVCGLFFIHANPDHHGLDIQDFGAEPNQMAVDQGPLIQAALDSAEKLGHSVWVPVGRYYCQTGIRIPGGVRLLGEGAGHDPLGTFPSKGSVIAYLGGEWAIELIGHQAGIENLAIVDRSFTLPSVSAQYAKGAIRIAAADTIFEGIHLENVLISSFIHGTAIKLEASGKGGIAYGLFQNIRVRHGRGAIHIAEGADAYINSNRFLHGAISGGGGGDGGSGFEFGILVEGGNNNSFQGLIIEPVSSDIGHLVVQRGRISARDLRIEGPDQIKNGLGHVPLIYFAEGSFGSSISGNYDGKGLVDLGQNHIDFHSTALDFENPGYNLLTNAAFKGFDAVYKVLPFWRWSAPVLEVETLPAEIIADHMVLRMLIAPGQRVELAPQIEFIPATYQTGRYLKASFGCFVRHAQPSAQVAAIHHSEFPRQDVQASSVHPGDGAWHFVGLSPDIFGSDSTQVFPAIQLDNQVGTQPLEVWLSTPSYHFGTQRNPQLESAFISSAGGIMTGTLSLGISQADSISYGENYRIVLRQEGNVFQIRTDQTIMRINDEPSDRFPSGSIIHLLFDQPNTTVHHNAFIGLLDGQDYVSKKGSSLTLISLGNGLWRELSRNL